MAEDKTLYLIDGSAYIYRAFHAIRNLTDSRGFPTNAIYGFTRMLLKLFDDRQPAYVGLFLDAKGPTFRHRIFEAYKANRPPMPDELAVQIPHIKAVAEGFNLTARELQGFEADDLIGTTARLAAAQGCRVVMVTGDKDFIQLIAERVQIWDPMKDRVMDGEAVQREFAVAPAQMVDVMGLAGDSSDNVPGVPGASGSKRRWS